jgi:hypothetical protein
LVGLIFQLPLAHAKVVSNTSFSNGFTSEVFFQNELEDMSQKSGSPGFRSCHFCTIALPPVQIIFLVLPSIPSHAQ